MGFNNINLMNRRGEQKRTHSHLAERRAKR